MFNWVRENNFTRADQYSESVVTFIHEWRPTSSHFIHKDAKSPPINLISMTFHVKNFGSQILSRATEAKGLIVFSKEFGEAEVGQTNVTLFVHKNVFWLEIPMYDLIAMQVTESKNNLSSDKLDCCLIKSLHSVKVVVDISAGNVFEEEVNSQFILEYVLHVIHKGMVRLE
jgi:hypothetical protein